MAEGDEDEDDEEGESGNGQGNGYNGVAAVMPPRAVGQSSPVAPPPLPRVASPPPLPRTPASPTAASSPMQALPTATASPSSASYEEPAWKKQIQRTKDAKAMGDDDAAEARRKVCCAPIRKMIATNAHLYTCTPIRKCLPSTHTYNPGFERRREKFVIKPTT